MTPVSISNATPLGITAHEVPAAQFTELKIGDFSNLFQRKCFLFKHNLVEHSAFSVSGILDRLEAGLEPVLTHYDAGQIRVNQRWDESPRPPMSLSDTLRAIDNAGAWVVLRGVDCNHEYERVLDQCMRSADALAGRPLCPKIRNKEMILFLTSPNRISNYHIDRECSYLMQISGSKTIYTFDGGDRSILSEEELERFWTVDNNAARYSESFQDKARAFHLTPGTGVHIPVNFPHWVKNDDNVSVSVNINVQFPDSMRANIYRANYHLRRLGFRPAPPFVSPAKDRLKAAAYGLSDKLAQRIGRRG